MKNINIYIWEGTPNVIPAVIGGFTLKAGLFP